MPDLKFYKVLMPTNMIPFFKSFLFVLLTLAAFAAAEELGDSDSKAINVRTWEDYKQSRPAEIQENCEEDEMRAYSLIGDSQSLSEPNELCPAIQQNCCGKKDQENIIHLWREDSKRIEYYTTFTLKVFRYILGHGKNFYRIAKSIVDDYKRKTPSNFQPVNMQTNNQANANHGQENSDGFVLNTNAYCKNAAHDVLTTNFLHESTAEPFYHQLNHKAEYLHNLRASFYCMLCSVEGQKQISSWRIFSSISNINYGPEFCKELVSHTFQVTYMLYENYNNLISNLIRMLTCVQVPLDRQTQNANLGGGAAPNMASNNDFESTNPPYELPEGVQQMISNPLGMSDSGSTYACDWATGSSTLFFLKCEYFCQKFNMAKANAFFEYDAFKLKNLFDYIRQYEDVFPNGSSTNMFRDDCITLVKDISEIYDKLPYEGRFFISKDERIDLAKYDSDFTRLSSFNPMALAEGHKLDFHYQFVSVLKFGLAVILAGLMMLKL